MSASDGETHRLAGVLCAAGRGRRMGRTKQLLPWPPPDGDGTVVEAAFDVIAPACDEMLVLLGHDGDEVDAALEGRDHHRLRVDPDADLLATIRAGLHAVLEWQPDCAVLLHLADHPMTAPATVEAIVAARVRHPAHAILPEHAGKGGHPVLVPHELIPAILAWDGEGGLRAFWERHAEQVCRLPVDDAGCVRDLDVEADWRDAAP